MTAISVSYVVRPRTGHVRRMLGVAAVLVGAMGMAASAQAQVARPDCEAVAPWAAGFDRNDEWQPNALGSRHRLPRLFVSQETEALFGKPMLSWTEADAMSVREVVLACRQATKDRELSGAYNAMQSALVSRVANFSKALADARSRAGTAMNALQSAPPSLPLLSFHSALEQAATAQGYARLPASANGLAPAASNAARELIAALRDLPEAEIATLVAEPAARTALAMRDGVVEALLTEVRAVPVSLPGLGLLDRMAQALPRDYAPALGKEATESMLRAVTERRAHIATEIADVLVAQIGESSRDFDAFAQIDQAADGNLLRQLPQAQAARVHDAAQARRQVVADALFSDMTTKLGALPATDAALDSVDAALRSIAAWPASAAPFKPRFEEGARKRRAEILAAVDKAEAGAMRGRVYETGDKAHRFEFVDRTRVFVHEPGHTAAGTYTEEKDGRIVVTVNGESTVLTREGRRLNGWHTQVSRTK